MTFASHPMTDIIKAMQPTEHLVALSRMVATRQWEHREVYSTHIYDDMMKQIAQMRAFNESITLPFQAFTEKINSQYAVFEGLSTRLAVGTINFFSIPEFTQKTLAWNIASIGLSNRMKDIWSTLPTRGAFNTFT